MANTVYNSLGVAQKQPATTEGLYRNTIHLHDTVSLPNTFATTDTAIFGYIPPGAVVTGIVLKAQTQLDSNGAPTLTFNVGIPGTPQLFKAAVTTVGRVAGASVDASTSLAAAGYLYKNTTSGNLTIQATCQAAAATPVAGVLEMAVFYHVEEVVGSAA